MMRRPMTALVGLVLATSLVAAGCGGDDDDDASPAGDGATTTLEVTITADAISVPDEVKGGLVEVVYESPTDGMEVDFTRVTDGTTTDAFRTAIAEVIEGGPFADFIVTNVGVTATEVGTVREHVILDPGSYIAWAERPDDEDDDGDDEGGGEEPSTSPDDILAQAFTVVEGPAAELPETDGTITASDYTFDIDAGAGDKYTFVNDGPDQLHHVVVFNFGDLDPSVVEENFPAFMESEEDAPPPEAFADLDFENLEAGGSGVFGPGTTGTFTMTLESGNTYAAVCFISDREGGPPHAFGHQMFKVFAID